MTVSECVSTSSVQSSPVQVDLLSSDSLSTNKAAHSPTTTAHNKQTTHNRGEKIVLFSRAALFGLFIVVVFVVCLVCCSEWRLLAFVAAARLALVVHIDATQKLQRKGKRYTRHKRRIQSEADRNETNHSIGVASDWRRLLCGRSGDCALVSVDSFPVQFGSIEMYRPGVSHAIRRGAVGRARSSSSPLGVCSCGCAHLHPLGSNALRLQLQRPNCPSLPLTSPSPAAAMHTNSTHAHTHETSTLESKQMDSSAPTHTPPAEAALATPDLPAVLSDSMVESICFDLLTRGRQSIQSGSPLPEPITLPPCTAKQRKQMHVIIARISGNELFHRSVGSGADRTIVLEYMLPSSSAPEVAPNQAPKPPSDQLDLIRSVKHTYSVWLSGVDGGRHMTDLHHFEPLADALLHLKRDILSRPIGSATAEERAFERIIQQVTEQHHTWVQSDASDDGPSSNGLLERLLYICLDTSSNQSQSTRESRSIFAASSSPTICPDTKLMHRLFRAFVFNDLALGRGEFESGRIFGQRHGSATATDPALTHRLDDYTVPLDSDDQPTYQFRPSQVVWTTLVKGYSACNALIEVKQIFLRVMPYVYRDIMGGHLDFFNQVSMLSHSAHAFLGVGTELQRRRAIEWTMQYFDLISSQEPKGINLRSLSTIESIAYLHESYLRFAVKIADFDMVSDAMRRLSELDSLRLEQQLQSTYTNTASFIDRHKVILYLIEFYSKQVSKVAEAERAQFAGETIATLSQRQASVTLLPHIHSASLANFSLSVDPQSSARVNPLFQLLHMRLAELWFAISRSAYFTPDRLMLGILSNGVRKCQVAGATSPLLPLVLDSMGGDGSVARRSIERAEGEALELLRQTKPDLDALADIIAHLEQQGIRPPTKLYNYMLRAHLNHVHLLRKVTRNPTRFLEAGETVATIGIKTPLEHFQAMHQILHEMRTGGTESGEKVPPDANTYLVLVEAHRIAMVGAEDGFIDGATYDMSTNLADHLPSLIALYEDMIQTVPSPTTDLLDAFLLSIVRIEHQPRFSLQLYQAMLINGEVNAYGERNEIVRWPGVVPSQRTFDSIIVTLVGQRMLHACLDAYTLMLKLYRNSDLCATLGIRYQKPSAKLFRSILNPIVWGQETELLPVVPTLFADMIGLNLPISLIHFHLFLLASIRQNQSSSVSQLIDYFLSDPARVTLSRRSASLTLDSLFREEAMEFIVRTNDFDRFAKLHEALKPAAIDTWVEAGMTQAYWHWPFRFYMRWLHVSPTVEMFSFVLDSLLQVGTNQKVILSYRQWSNIFHCFAKHRDSHSRNSTKGGETAWSGGTLPYWQAKQPVDANQHFTEAAALKLATSMQERNLIQHGFFTKIVDLVQSGSDPFDRSSRRHPTRPSPPTKSAITAEQNLTNDQPAVSSPPPPPPPENEGSDAVFETMFERRQTQTKPTEQKETRQPTAEPEVVDLPTLPSVSVASSPPPPPTLPPPPPPTSAPVLESSPIVPSVIVPTPMPTPAAPPTPTATLMPPPPPQPANMQQVNSHTRTPTYEKTSYMTDKNVATEKAGSDAAFETMFERRQTRTNPTKQKENQQLTAEPQVDEKVNHTRLTPNRNNQVIEPSYLRSIHSRIIDSTSIDSVCLVVSDFLSSLDLLAASQQSQSDFSSAIAFARPTLDEICLTVDADRQKLYKSDLHHSAFSRHVAKVHTAAGDFDALRQVMRKAVSKVLGLASDSHEAELDAIDFFHQHIFLLRALRCSAGLQDLFLFFASHNHLTPAVQVLHHILHSPVHIDQASSFVKGTDFIGLNSQCQAAFYRLMRSALARTDELRIAPTVIYRLADEYHTYTLQRFGVAHLAEVDAEHAALSLERCAAQAESSSEMTHSLLDRVMSCTRAVRSRPATDLDWVASASLQTSLIRGVDLHTLYLIVHRCIDACLYRQHSSNPAVMRLPESPWPATIQEESLVHTITNSLLQHMTPPALSTLAFLASMSAQVPDSLDRLNECDSNFRDPEFDLLTTGGHTLDPLFVTPLVRLIASQWVAIQIRHWHTLQSAGHHSLPPANSSDSAQKNRQALYMYKRFKRLRTVIQRTWSIQSTPSEEIQIAAYKAYSMIRVDVTPNSSEMAVARAIDQVLHLKVTIAGINAKRPDTSVLHANADARRLVVDTVVSALLHLSLCGATPARRRFASIEVRRVFDFAVEMKLFADRPKDTLTFLQVMQQHHTHARMQTQRPDQTSQARFLSAMISKPMLSILADSSRLAELGTAHYALLMQLVPHKDESHLNLVGQLIRLMLRHPWMSGEVACESTSDGRSAVIRSHRQLFESIVDFFSTARLLPQVLATLELMRVMKIESTIHTYHALIHVLTTSIMKYENQDPAATKTIIAVYNAMIDHARAHQSVSESSSCTPSDYHPSPLTLSHLLRACLVARVPLSDVLPIWSRLTDSSVGGGFDLQPTVDHMTTMVQIFKPRRAEAANQAVNACAQWAGQNRLFEEAHDSLTGASHLPPIHHPDVIRALLHFFLVHGTPSRSHQAKAILELWPMTSTQPDNDTDKRISETSTYQTVIKATRKLVNDIQADEQYRQTRLIHLDATPIQCHE